MFIRIKKIKNNQYGYLVENTWKKRKQSSRQKVKGYLGKIIALSKERTTPFSEDLQEKNFHESIVILLRWELGQYKFKEKEGKLVKEDITVNLKKKKIEKEGKSVVIKLNEGYLCDYTLKQLLQFKSKDYEEETGLQLAELIIGAGIDIPREVFIKLFEKVYKPHVE